MPWKSNEDLPDSLKKLPVGAKTIFRAAANAWFESHPGDDTGAMQVGWNAIKNKYKKDINGEWVKRSEGIIKIDKTNSYYRVRLKQPSEFETNGMDNNQTFATIDIDTTNGIKAIIGKPKGKSTPDVQAVLIPVSDDWDEAKVKKYINDKFFKKAGDK